MTPKQRMITALERGIPDRVPTFELEFQLAPELIGKDFCVDSDFEGLTGKALDDKVLENAKVLVEAYTLLEHDAICIQLKPELVARTVEAIHRIAGDTFLLMAHGDGTFAIPDGDGMYELSYRMVDEPESVKAQAARMCDEAIARNDWLLREGLDGFILCSDYCFNQGPFLSPQMFAEFIQPYLARIIAAIREGGGYAIKHTDGNIMPILDQLVAANPHALHSLDPMAGVDIRKVKELVGDKVALCGNVHCAAMQTGTEQDVVDSATYCMTWGKPGGGYVFATSNIPFRGLPLERYELALSVWRRMRDY